MVVSVLMIITKKSNLQYFNECTGVPLSLTFNNGVSEKGKLLNWFYRLNTDIEDIT